MKIKDIEVTCANCGKPVTIKVKLSFMSRDSGFDTKPAEKYLLRDIHQCPNCGYSGYDISKGSPTGYAYIWDPYDPSKTVYKNAIISTDDLGEKFDLLLNYTWFLEFENRFDEAKEIRDQALKQLDKAMETEEFVNNLNLEDMIGLACIYIDSLRQLERFDEAKEDADALKEVIHENKPNSYIEKVCDKLIEFINNKDAAPHMQSEIKE